MRTYEALWRKENPNQSKMQIRRTERETTEEEEEEFKEGKEELVDADEFEVEVELEVIDDKEIEADEFELRERLALFTPFKRGFVDELCFSRKKGIHFSPVPF
jgi:hypothetical protein